MVGLRSRASIDRVVAGLYANNSVVVAGAAVVLLLSFAHFCFVPC